MDYLFFGHSVALSRDHAVVGAHGKTYAFANGEEPWSQETDLTPNQRGLDFGSDVDILGDTVAVGDPTYGPGADHLGSAYLLTRHDTIWELTGQFLASVPALSANLGSRVALAFNYLFTSGRSSVYVFVLPNARATLRDLAAFQTCFGASQPTTLPECLRFNVCGDTRIDLCDLGELLATFAGP